MTRGAVVSCVREIQRCGHEAVGAVPIVDPPESLSRAKQQPSSRQEHERDRELTDEQQRTRGSRAATASAVAGRAKRELERLPAEAIRSQEAHSRSESEQQSGNDR